MQLAIVVAERVAGEGIERAERLGALLPRDGAA